MALGDQLLEVRDSRCSGLMWPMARPSRPGIRFSTFSAIGVKRRMRRSRADDHDGDLDAAEQVDEVAVDAAQLVVAAVQLLVDGVQLLVGATAAPPSRCRAPRWSLCSSSLLDRISSLADCSSSLAASSSWMIDWRYSRLAASSRCRAASHGGSSRPRRRPGVGLGRRAAAARLRRLRRMLVERARGSAAVAAGGRAG